MVGNHGQPGAMAIAACTPLHALHRMRPLFQGLHLRPGLAACQAACRINMCISINMHVALLQPPQPANQWHCNTDMA